MIRFLQAILPIAVINLICAAALGQSAFDVNYDVIRKSVVFIYAQSSDGQISPDGTGFLIQIPLKSRPGRSYVVLATARHMVDPSWTGCAVNNSTLVARFNTKTYDPKTNEAGTVDYDLSTSEMGNWIVPVDDSVDIAFKVLNMSKVDHMGAEYVAIPLTEFPKPDEIAAIDSGSQVMSAGLFLGASGKLRNYPVFKFGHVSSRPAEKIDFKDCPNGRLISSTQWVIAASLVPGNSGSPILFVPARYSGKRAFLLGVQSTSFVGWDVAGMAPIQFLIDSLKTSQLPDADFSQFDNPIPKTQSGTVVGGNVVIQGDAVVH